VKIIVSFLIKIIYNVSGVKMKKDKLDIIYEDKFIIVVNKPSHLLTIATAKEKERTLYHKVIEYEKKKNKNNKIFIVHRLDKDTSGLVMFAKDENTKMQLQENWDNVKRKYIAVVEGKAEKKSGTIKSYLKENNNFITYSTNDKNGKLAITKYVLLNTSKAYSLMDIEIFTGRKNQIRVHMNDINHPIVGDKKYGAKTNPLKRLGLHAYYLEFTHPVTKKLIILETKYPEQFANMFSKKK
jgi:23S rRNA pseudouridine1911/1915/1917 synthase